MDIDKEKRVIKFRAWSKILKLMTYDLKIFGINTSSIGVTDPKDPKYIYLNEAICNYQNMFDLMQFVGRTDKYGREIYEGDIVKWKYPCDDFHESDYIYGIVEWDEMNCQFNVKQLTEGFYECGNGSKEKLKFYGDRRNFEFGDLQVVGNIYKSPDFINMIEHGKTKGDKIEDSEIKDDHEIRNIKDDNEIRSIKDDDETIYTRHDNEIRKITKY